MNNGLSELKAACSSRNAVKDSEKLMEGESFWLAGRAAAAEPGSVALAANDRLSVVVSETSILEVKKDGDRFLARVKSGHPAVVRFEAVTTLQPSQATCGCSGPSHDPAASAARINVGGGTGHGTGPIIIDCIQCRIEMRCEYYLHGGSLHRICVPAIVCENVCVGIPT